MKPRGYRVLKQHHFVFTVPDTRVWIVVGYLNCKLHCCLDRERGAISLHVDKQGTAELYSVNDHIFHLTFDLLHVYSERDELVGHGTPHLIDILPQPTA